MTTLVATQQALELRSMSDQQDRRKTPSGFECDDDFQFIRKSKRVRTEEPPAAATSATTTSDGNAHITDAVSQAVPAATIPEINEAEEPSLVASPSVSKSRSRTGQRKSTRLKASQKSPQEEPPQARGRTTRNSTTRIATADKDDSSHPNGAARAGAAPRAAKPVRRWEPSPTPRRPAESSKIALPMNDTPIINRNKEMRKKGGKSNRRSSLGSRGRRASSLIDSGQTATPHREVEAREFYKHIAGDLPEPRRMKQLL
ncbi:hypothetical protein E4U43_002734, partial [Claviceps pusilla]